MRQATEFEQYEWETLSGVASRIATDERQHLRSIPLLQFDKESARKGRENSAKLRKDRAR